MDLKYLILMIAVTTVEINVTESRQNDKRRWKNEKTLHSHYINICDIQDRVSKVHCYCESIKIKTATKADCWVFNGGIAEDDPFWSNFYSQPKIERLTFNVRADGGLTYIPAKVIVRLDRLQYLNIQYANIPTIPSFAFTNSTTLREISLPRNKITQLDRMAFAHLIMLSNVSLVENQLSELDRDVFYVLPNLQKLHLSKNSLTVLHDGCFKHLNNLIKLDLDGNLLTVVVRENFQGLSNLINLDMQNNKLRMIGDLAFAELWSLQELYLDRNEIEFISQRGFGGLTQLRKLTLSDNKLAMFEDGLFTDTPKLSVLDLRNNYLETLKLEVVAPVLENMNSNYALVSLDVDYANYILCHLSYKILAVTRKKEFTNRKDCETSYLNCLKNQGNKLICDCRLSWLHRVRNETKSKRLKLHLDRLNCIIETKQKTTEILEKANEVQKKESNERYLEDYDVSSSGDDEKNYNEMRDQDSFQSGVEYRRKILEIPLETLPCPRKLVYKGELNPPTQDEVKYYKSSANYLNIKWHFMSTALFTSYILLF